VADVPTDPAHLRLWDASGAASHEHDDTPDIAGVKGSQKLLSISRVALTELEVYHCGLTNVPLSIASLTLMGTLALTYSTLTCVG